VHQHRHAAIGRTGYFVVRDAVVSVRAGAGIGARTRGGIRMLFGIFILVVASGATPASTRASTAQRRAFMFS
jgi:hypothetical protein